MDEAVQCALPNRCKESGKPISQPLPSDGGNSLAEVVCNDVERIREPLLPPECRDEKASCSGGEIQASLRSGKRLASLDIFRGLTIAVMILVDDAGGLWPAINHSPWNGVTLADFVMPFFLFIVGVSLVLALKNVFDKRAAIQKIILRVLKLFALGIILQGGYFHGANDLYYGVDVEHIRIMGILQRIGLAYLLVAVCEVLTKNKSLTDTEDLIHTNYDFARLLKMYRWHWVMVLLLSFIYLGLLYGLIVPDWHFEALAAEDGYNVSKIELKSLTVKCNVRGDLGPACNAIGFVDRAVMGISHLYQHPVYRRTKECSANSPDYGLLPPGAPPWCLAPFDPEGLLSSIMAMVSCFIGAHYGHALVQFKDHKRRLLEWITSAFVLLLLGTIVDLFGMPLNKPLYTISYTCITAGVAGLVFSAFYVLVDVYKKCRHPLSLLEWMGMNALLIYILAASEVFPAAVQGFYWRSPEFNLVTFIEESIFQSIIHSKKWAKLVYVLFEILFWCLVAGVLKINGIFWKF